MYFLENNLMKFVAKYSLLCVCAFSYLSKTLWRLVFGWFIKLIEETRSLREVEGKIHFLCLDDGKKESKNWCKKLNVFISNEFRLKAE